MTAPASLLATAANLAAKPAPGRSTGEASGAAVGGFEALLAALSAGGQTGTRQVTTGNPGAASSDPATADTGPFDSEADAARKATDEIADPADDLGGAQATGLAAGLAGWSTRTTAASGLPTTAPEADASSPAGGAATSPALEGPITCDLPQGKPTPAPSLTSSPASPAGPLDLTALPSLRPQPGQSPEAVIRGLAGAKSPTTAVGSAAAGQAPPVAPSTGAAQTLPPAQGAKVDQAAAPALDPSWRVASPSGADQTATGQAAIVMTAATQAAGLAPAAPGAEATAASTVVAPSLDPKASATRKSDASVSVAAGLKAAREADRPSGAGDLSVGPAPASAEDDGAAIEIDPDPAPTQDALAAEPETPPPTSRQPETAAQMLAGRLDSAAAAAASLAAQARSLPETVTRLAAGIVEKLSGQATRFDLQLDPHGLGKVDVSVEIGSDGRLAASLNFDSAQAANELRGRAQDLRQALEQAGFSLNEGSLSFDFAGDNRGQRQTSDSDDLSGLAGRAFARALGALDDEALLPIRFQSRQGLDLRI